MSLLSVENKPLLDEEPARYDGTITSEHVEGEQKIVFHDLSYHVVEGVFRKRPKTILNHISGMLPPGVNAIMGPTGSGKSSLLDVLAGRKNKKGLHGTVLVNGVVQPKNFRYMSGYVLQDDVIMETLSVKENLYFSAALRLPNSMSWSEKKQRVKRVIGELGLNHCVDTKMGNEYFRGVSGGERKRTSIGMELIIEPDVLFLDEPTTGLDAYTAVATVLLLKQLCMNTNRIIVMSIHQPRYSIFKLFDTLTLLSKGEMVYHGPSFRGLDYFSTLGFDCEEHDNPADFLLDVINLCERRDDQTLGTLPAIEQAILKDSKAIDLTTAYRHSNEYKSTLSKCERAVANRNITKNRSSFFSISNYATNALWQFIVVLIRSLINLVRNPTSSFVQYIVTITFAVIVGAIYWQVDTGINGYQNRLGAVFFMIMNQVFTNLSAIDLFVRQRKVFVNENLSGYYRVSVYFLAKATVDLFCYRFFPLCFFTVITYFMLGFQIDVAKFFTFFLTLFLTSFCAASAVFWVSAGVRVAGIGNQLIALCFVIQMLFGGFFIALESLPVYVRWLQYLSIFRYSVEALIVNEVNGLQFEQLIAGGDVVPVNGTELLENQGFDVDWLWYNQIGLVGLCVLFLTLGYVTLRLIKKER